MQNEMRGIRNPRGQVGFVADMKERNYMQPVSSFASIFWGTLDNLKIKNLKIRKPKNKLFSSLKNRNQGKAKP